MVCRKVDRRCRISAERADAKPRPVSGPLRKLAGLQSGLEFSRSRRALAPSRKQPSPLECGDCRKDVAAGSIEVLSESRTSTRLAFGGTHLPPNFTQKTAGRLQNAEIANAERTRNIGAERKARTGRGVGPATAGNFSGQRSSKNHATNQTNRTEVVCPRHLANAPLSHPGRTSGSVATRRSADIRVPADATFLRVSRVLVLNESLASPGERGVFRVMPQNRQPSPPLKT
jgi:hypothetical protein